jgi:Spy/CpxP family protein refolding chaperone
MIDAKFARGAVAGLGLLAATAAAPLAWAQDAAFDDATIDAFVTAQLEIREIRSSYMPRLEGAGTDEERQQLTEQATDEMVTAVDDTPGITVDEYNAIVQAAGSDPELAERLSEELAAPSQ